MAIYHFSAQMITRGQGRSIVAASAYRAGEKIIDSRLGFVQDYTKKSDVLEKTILLPDGAPKWMSYREKLWNHVELIEKRKDAQLAREINISLPKEFSQTQNWALIQGFVKQTFVDKGMVADIAFHQGHQKGEVQPHAHVLLSLREIDASGFGKKVRAWNQKVLLNEWRAHWAEYCNRCLALEGFDLRIDHRTLEAQGIDLEPQSKIGAKAAQDKLIKMAEHQAIAKRNGERLLQSPEIALFALTNQQSTFTHQDLARFVHRHTLDVKQFSAVYETLKNHDELIALGEDNQGQMRFTTRELLTLEHRMITQAKIKAEHLHHGVCAENVRAAIEEKGLSDIQAQALRYITQSNDLSCLVGYAGSGKSYLLGAAKAIWQAQGYEVCGVALSGIAAENLEKGSGIESHTIANRSWYWSKGQEKLSDSHVLVVDEAAMLGSRQMSDILAQAAKSGAKVVLVGDSEQLQAIEAGAAYRAIAERVGFMEITEVRRQKVDWQKQATQAFAAQRTEEGLKSYEAHEATHGFSSKEEAMAALIDKWEKDRNDYPNSSSLILAYTKAEVKALNEAARSKRGEKGELGADVFCETSQGQRALAKNERIYFLRNDKTLGVKNGTLGTIISIKANKLTVALDSLEKEAPKQVTFNLRDYHHIDHGYAATVYKAQGVTVERSYVLASNYFDRHSTYVAMSRHQVHVDLYWSQSDFPNFEKLTQTLAQAREKDVSLDYARIRGLETQEQESVWVQEKLQGSHQTIELDSKKDWEKAKRRAAKSAYQQAQEVDIKALQQKTGLICTLDLKAGDKGIYRGMVEIAERPYGVLEQEAGQAKLVPAAQISVREKGKTMVLEAQGNVKTQQKLRAVLLEQGRGKAGMSFEIEE